MGLTAAQWNELVPKGTPVRYWSVRNEFRPWFAGQSHVNTRTRSEAWQTPGGHVLVKVEGVAGGVWIDHLAVDAAKVMRDAQAAIKSQTIKVCVLHGAQPCTCRPPADLDQEPPPITEEQLEAVAEELGRDES